MAERVLVVDDDPSFLRLIEEVLSKKGYQVLRACEGQQALKLFFTRKPDLVLLDVAMPGLDGWEVCSRIRNLSDVPIIMITGKKQEEDDIVRGLNYGADEYLLKPVGNRELEARVRAVLRRAELPSPAETTERTTYSDGFLSIDVLERKVIVNGERVRLTPREFRLLALLIENAGHFLTTKQILEKVWGWEYIDDLDYVRIYIYHLRRKIEPNPSVPRYIVTEPGVGYSFQKARGGLLLLES